MTAKVSKKITFKQYHNFLGQNKKFLNLKDEKYLQRLKVKKKGGYPRGTKRGDGGLPDAFMETWITGNLDDLLDQHTTSFEKKAEVSTNSEESHDKMGLIRKIKGAHLVFKRQVEDGTYTEMWIYYDDIINSTNVRQEILAGTDIDPKTGFSEDKQQTYEIWSPGNVEILVITGLPS